jgi:UDP-N-acetylglucosamine 2-epimerase (non-hydrolysing)
MNGDDRSVNIINVVGARPNFIKIAPIMEELRKHEKIRSTLVHTGQHYDYEMSAAFFADLSLSDPDIHLGVGSGSQAEQTGKIMMRFEKVLVEYNPDLVVVVGDVNSTLACTLAATKLHVPVAHVEAGLRSYDRMMAEEINRRVTDAVSDYLFVTEKSGEENLLKEGIAPSKIFFVGNVMIDTLLKYGDKASRSSVLSELNLVPREYAVLTLHRPENVDSKETFSGLVSAVDELCQRIRLVYPVHPRTQRRIDEYGLQEHFSRLSREERCVQPGPLPYLDFLRLMSRSKFVLTDSGGIQEETTALRVPCLTLRRNTERPVTVVEGTNTVVGVDPERILHESLRILDGHSKGGKVPELWDGRAAKRIVNTLLENLKPEKGGKCGGAFLLHQ